MFKKNSKLILKYADSEKIWHYMDFTKFVNLLDTGSLFFCRADMLEDKWEGIFPEKMIYKFNLSKNSIQPDDKNIYSWREWRKKETRSHLINSWHVNAYESDAMWKLYSSSKQSIAIQSTIGRLKRSFAIAKNIIWIGEVEYIDFKNWEPKNRVFNTSELNILKTFFLKRIGFEHEKEIRAITYVVNNKHKEDKGILVNVDLNELVETIVISPTSEDWFFNLVKNIIYKFNYQYVPKKSELSIQPYI